MSQICSFAGCKYTPYEDYQECILHCDKSKTLSDLANNDAMLSVFCDELANYIINSKNIQNKASELKQEIDIDSIKDFLILGMNAEKLEEVCRETYIFINRIIFPSRGVIHEYDFFQILKKFGKIEFINCNINNGYMDLSKSKVFFNQCEFHSNWYVSIVDNMSDLPLYESCKFYGDASLMFEDGESQNNASYFRNCNFYSSLYIKNSICINKIFDNGENYFSKVYKLIIKESVFKEELILNNVKIDELYIRNTKFLSKVEMQKGNIVELNINNSQFESSFDAYGTNFGKFEVSNTTFNDFAGFERCEFGKAGDENGVAQFEYVTFLSFANIRNTIFHQGLNLEDTNLKEAPNFLNIQLLSDNTNRETYRIIKHSFDKIGNHIEANHFYAKEMDKYQ